jgi:hypothetical protein
MKTIDYYFKFFGLKQIEKDEDQEKVIFIENLQEELKINLLYHKARNEYLVKLNELNDELFNLDDRIDAINKSQLSKRTRHQSVRDIIISKDVLTHLMHRVVELINVISTKDITLPMREMDYTILCNFEHFIQHVLLAYEKLKTVLQERATKLNVTL